MENNMKTLPGEHLVTETIRYQVYYPNHAERAPSARFNKTKRNLIHIKDTPCWICGSKERREVHHYHVEWAYADGVDWDKMKSLHPTFDWTQFRVPEDFVDHEYNMMVLCEEHHRGPGTGIHQLPYPVWVMQKHKRLDFILSEKIDK
jgi:hypothetical protein